MLATLCLGTIAFSIFRPPYEPHGTNLLRNADFESGLAGWNVTLPGARHGASVSAANGILSLGVMPMDVPRRVSLLQEFSIAGDNRLVQLSAWARTQNLVPGEKPWERARIVLAPEDAGRGLRYDVPHTLASLAGSTRWTRYTQVFRIPAENTIAAVVIQVPNATGIFEVRSLSLRAVREVPGFATWRQALMVIWCVAALWIAWPLLRVGCRRPGGQLVVGTATMILLGVLVSAPVKYLLTPSWLLPESEAPGPFRADLLPDSVPFRFDPFPLHMDAYKAAHFLLFAVLGYVLRATRPFHVPAWTQFGLVGLFALATEAMQTLAAGRGGSIEDLLTDVAGVGAGAATAVMRSRWLRSANRQ